MVKPKPHTSGMKILLNGLLDSGFVVSKVDPCMFMSNTGICAVYVYDCLFWECTQSDIDNVMNSFK